MRILVLSVLLVALFAAIGTADAYGKPSVLVISGWSLNHLIDDTYKEKMEADGYRLDSCKFEGLTWDRIKQFNVLVIIRTPHANSEKDHPAYTAALPLIKRFLDQGGGALWLYDPSYSQTHLTVNEFMKDYGLEVLDESVFDDDPAHKFRQELYNQREFITTTRIAPHPTTAGIDTVAFPAWPYAACPFKAGPEWQVLITGEPSAYAHNPYSKVKSFPSSPPVFAVREAGKGRMAVYTVMSTFLVQAGYHRIWEGIVLDRGNGHKLLRNTYDWLAEPSLAPGALGGFAGKGSGTAEAEECIYNAYPMDLQTAPRRVYRGLIGAHSDVAGGSASVADLCKAARRAGLNFLVFTEPMDKMNKVIWRKLVAQCAEQSWGDFVAIPGFEYKEPDGCTRICFNNKDWLPDDALDEKGFLRHPAHPLFDFAWPTVTYVASHHPELDGSAYHAQKFYTSLSLFTYDRGRLIDDSTDRYKVLTGDNYYINPLAIHKISTASDVTAAAKDDSYKTSVLAPSIKEVPQAMRPKFSPDCPFGKASYVSNGPRIEDFRLIGPGWTLDIWEPYYLWQAGETAEMVIGASSDCSLTDVIVYRGSQPYWHFRPESKQFRTKLPYVFEQGGNLWMEVVDAKGRRAYSYSQMIRHDTWWSQACADLQNTLQGGLFPAAKGGMLFRGGRRALYGGMGGIVTGINAAQISPINSGEIIPDGLDAIFGGFGLDMVARVAIDGRVIAPATPRHSFVHATGAVSVMESYGDTLFDQSYQPAACKDFVYVTRRTASPCRPDGYNVVEVEQTVRFLRDVEVSDAGGALPVTLLTLSGDKSLFPNASFDQDGQIRRIDRNSMTEPVVGKLDAYGGVCIYPQYWGNGAVFAIDGKSYDVRITGSDVSIGLDALGRRFRKGEVITARFLVMRDSGRDPDDSGERSVAANYGVAGKPAYALEASGKVVRGVSPTVVAKGRCARIRVSKCDLPNDLVVRVKGVEPNWSVICYDTSTGKSDQPGVFGDTAYVSLDTRTAKDVCVANALTCSDRDVRLTVVRSRGGLVTFEAHNLSAKRVTTVVESAGPKAGLPGFRRKLALSPGEMKIVKVGSRGAR